MQYGGTNDIVRTCPLCNESCDKHKPLRFVQSDAYTENLASTLQRLLDDVVKRALLKGFDRSRDSCMIGAARATINSSVRTYVTISGANLTPLQHIDKGQLGKDVEVVSLDGVAQFFSISGRRFDPQPTPQRRNRDYIKGACAAQKLLSTVFQRAGGGDVTRKITKLNMAEILWCDPAGGGNNSQWSTGHLACSCDTCKQVLPMMLCSGE